MNVPPSIGVVVSSGLATLHQLDTVYGVKDLHDLMEIVTVDAYNKWLAMQHRE